MATDDELPSERIKRMLLQRPEECVDVSIELLTALSESLGKIIGERGVESLLSRAARRVALEHPWLRFDPDSPAEQQFQWLRDCCAGQSAPAQQSAGIGLLTAFVDILSALIGTHLTTIILDNAIGCTGNAGKNSKEQDNG